ncbi:hypothetical protein [Candidatus Leptofilum sp.]|uniref:hypothetical protein n=1 Tax=Candidatus Leptofilum sp. TaxID=3241576 RepID=UPI003B596C50
MRFIVKEQDYEKPIGAGLLRYELDGVPTGAVEHWRLTEATDGYEVLRVDLDAREAASGHSYLYHLVRRTDGAPERLAYRFWGSGLHGKLQIEGTLLFSETNITGTRAVNGRTYHEDLNIEPGTLFWFPSAIGLGLVLQAKKVAGNTAVTLNGKIGGEDTLAMQQVSVDVDFLITDTKPMEVAGKTLETVPTMVRWNDNQRIVIRDQNYWPVAMQRPDFADSKLLLATETRYTWY